MLNGGGLAPAGVPNTFGGQSVVLDAGGRVTSLAGATLAWDERGMLSSITQAGATTTYAYDAEGRRIATSASGALTTNYVWEGADVIGEIDATTAVTATYLYDGIDHPLRRIDHPTGAHVIVYYELDLAGNVRRLRAPGGADLGGYRYTAFGRLMPADAKTPMPSAAGAVNQPLMWKARWYSPLAGGIYDVRARVWSPAIASFLSADAFRYLRTSGTLWSWPGQNPIRWRDSSGHDWDVDMWILRNGADIETGLLATSMLAATIATGGMLGEGWAAAGGARGLLAAGGMARFGAGIAGAVPTLAGLMGIATPRANALAGLAEACEANAGNASEVARGLGQYLGIFESKVNAAGGDVVTSTGSIVQREFGSFVNSGLMKGNDVSILSGVHGNAAGDISPEPQFFADDMSQYGGIDGVTVYDFMTMTEAQVVEVINGPNTTIGAFCNSGVCLEKYMK
jgi:RHS repeat-associated protein